MMLQIFMGMFFSIFILSCTMKSPEKHSTLRISIPHTVRSSARSLEKIDTQGFPTELTDINCYGINVTGTEILNLPLPKTSCRGKDYDLFHLGITNGFVKAESKVELDIDVPEGPARTIQLLGIYSKSGTCPSFTELFDPKELSRFLIYEIVSTQADIYGDITTIHLTPVFDANKRIEGCAGLGEIDANTSTISVVPSSILADGNREGIVTATIRDRYGNPVPEKSITLATSRSNQWEDTLSPISSVTNSKGEATFKIKSQSVGTSILTAASGSISFSSNLNFYDRIQIKEALFTNYNQTSTFNVSGGLESYKYSIIAGNGQITGGVKAFDFLSDAGTSTVRIDDGTNQVDFGVQANGPGQPDIKFGSGNNISSISIAYDGGAARGIAMGITVDANKNIITTGSQYSCCVSTRYNVAVARVQNNGNTDTTFGTTGGVGNTFGNGDATATSLMIQSTGKLVLAGLSLEASYNKLNPSLFRYNTDGTLDKTFGGANTGYKSIAINASSTFNAVAQQMVGLNEYIVAVGTGTGALIARFDKDGNPDNTFGVSGLQDFDTTVGQQSIIKGMSIQSADQMIVAVGTKFDQASSQNYFTTWRWKSDGTSIDTNFASGAGLLQETGLGAKGSRANAVAIDANKNIVVVGKTMLTDTSSDWAIKRYLSNGSADTTFGTGGLFTINWGPGLHEALAIDFQADGKIIVVGGVNLSRADITIDPTPNSGGLGVAGIARLNTDGTLDSTFGTGGKATFDADGLNNYNAGSRDNWFTGVKVAPISSGGERIVPILAQDRKLGSPNAFRFYGILK